MRRKNLVLQTLGDFLFEIVLLLSIILMLASGCGHPGFTEPIVLTTKSEGRCTHDFWTHPCPCVTVRDVNGANYNACGTSWAKWVHTNYNVGDTIR